MYHLRRRTIESVLTMFTTDAPRRRSSRTRLAQVAAWSARWVSSAPILLALWMSLPQPAAGADRTPRVGEAAPDFEAITADGRKLRLADFKGQVLVINFWATWCTPCKQEMPLLNGYLLAQQDNGMRVIAITTEDSLPIQRLKKVADALSFPLIKHFKGDYTVLKAVPTNYIIDRRGVLRYAQAAVFTLESLNELIVPLLREPADGAPRPTAQADSNP